MSAPGARCSSATPMTAKMAVAPPCMIAVPKPRTIHVPMPASRRRSRKWAFSTNANPVPTAKPKIAASTRKPMRWARISPTMTRLFNSSSVTGET